MVAVAPSLVVSARYVCESRLHPTSPAMIRLAKAATECSHPRIGDHDYSSLRYFLYGAAPMSAAKLAEAMGRFGPVMAQAYGQTETPAGISFLAPEEHFDAQGKINEKRLLSCGPAFPFTRVALLDDDGNVVQRGEVGEIVVQGGIVMRGYYKNPEETEEAGQLGRHHTGGFNVYPLEVDQVILAHPAVQDCAVVGAPDAKWGEAVTAVVELKIGSQVEAEELIAACRHKLGGVCAVQ